MLTPADEVDARLALFEYERHAALVWRLGLRGEPVTCELIAARERFLVLLDVRALDAFRLRLGAWLLTRQRTMEGA